MTDSYISHDEFVSVNDMLKKYHMKEQIKNLKTFSSQSYCLECRKNTESKKPRLENTKNRQIILSSNCMVSGIKKLRFIKKQEANRTLSSLAIKTPSRCLFSLGWPPF